MELFKYSILIIYLLSVIGLAAAVFLSKVIRDIFFKIHRSKTDSHSWVRYASSFVLVMTIGIAVYQTTYSDVNVGAVSLLIGVAFAGKVVQTSINKDK